MSNRRLDVSNAPSPDVLRRMRSDALRRLEQKWSNFQSEMRDAHPSWRLAGIDAETAADRALAVAGDALVNIKAELAVRQARGSIRGDAAPRKPVGFVHSPDYRSVSIQGTTYLLTPGQAHVVEILHRARKEGTPEVGIHYVLEKLGTPNSRWQDTFRDDYGAKDALIESGAKKGTLRLKI